MGCPGRGREPCIRLGLRCPTWAPGSKVFEVGRRARGSGMGGAGHRAPPRRAGSLSRLRGPKGFAGALGLRGEGGGSGLLLSWRVWPWPLLASQGPELLLLGLLLGGLGRGMTLSGKEGAWAAERGRERPKGRRGTGPPHR